MSLFGGGSSGFGMGDALGAVGALAGLYGIYDAYKGGGSQSGSETVRQEPAPRDADGQTIWNAFMESLMGTGNWNKVQEERAAAAASPGTSILGNLTSSINGGGNSRGRTTMNGSGDIGGYESALGDRSISLGDLGSLRDIGRGFTSFGTGTLAAMTSPFAAGVMNMRKDATINNLSASLNDVAASMNYSSPAYGIDPKTGLAINTFGYNSGSGGGGPSTYGGGGYGGLGIGNPGSYGGVNDPGYTSVGGYSKGGGGGKAPGVGGRGGGMF